MIIMFMSDAEKQPLVKLFHSLAQHFGTDSPKLEKLQLLQQKYGVKS